MENYSSEIEVAIKIGEVRLTGSFTGSYGDQVVEFTNCLALLGVKLLVDPINNRDLSKGLRVLTKHKGDISFDRFMLSINWNYPHEVKIAAAFILGIGYIYPPSSLSDIIKCTFNPVLPEGYNNSFSIIDLYDTARKLYAKSLQMTADYKAKQAE